MSDYVDYSFLGFIIGLITLVGGTGLALSIYLRTIKKTEESLTRFKSRIVSDPDSQSLEFKD